MQTHQLETLSLNKSLIKHFKACSHRLTIDSLAFQHFLSNFFKLKSKRLPTNANEGLAPPEKTERKQKYEQNNTNGANRKRPHSKNNTQ